MTQPKATAQPRRQRQPLIRRKLRQQRQHHQRQDEVEASFAGGQFAPNVEVGDARQQQSLLNHPYSSAFQRQALATRIGQAHGNRQLTALLKPLQADTPVPNTEVLQTQERGKKEPANPGGRGPGKMQGAKEGFYEVKGKQLVDLLPQLKKFDGFAAETCTPVRFKYAAPTREKGKWTTTVGWIVDEATTKLPRWMDYDTASTAAQTEWGRYLQQTRQHEEERHIQAVKEYVQTRPTSFTAKSAAKLVKVVNQEGKCTLQYIQTEIHDQCGHGVEIDAILHAERDAEQ